MLEGQTMQEAEALDDVDATIDAALEHWTDEEEAPGVQDGVQQPGGGEEPGVVHTLPDAPSNARLFFSLPKEVLIRIWSFLSVEDLSRSALICRAARDLSEEPVLWRRLYCARFGKPLQQQGEWKAQYQHRDAQERVAMEAADDDNDQMGALYKDMQKARRQLALGRGRVDDTMEVPRSATQERLAAWRATYPPVKPGQPVRSYAASGSSANTSSNTPAYTPSYSASNAAVSRRPTGRPVPNWAVRQPGFRASDSSSNTAGCQQAGGACGSSLQEQLSSSPAGSQGVQGPAVCQAGLLQLQAPVEVKALLESGKSVEATQPAGPLPGPLDLVLLPAMTTAVPPVLHTDCIQQGHNTHAAGYDASSAGSQLQHQEPGSVPLLQPRAEQAVPGVAQQGPGHVQGAGGCPVLSSGSAGVRRPRSRAVQGQGQAGRPGMSSDGAGRLSGYSRRVAPPPGARSGGADGGGGVSPAGVSGAAEQQEAVRPDLEGQGRDAFTWDQIGDWFCCRETGWVHLCDHTCREAIIDSAHDLWVCPISCRTVDRMVTEWELRALARTHSGPVGHDEADGVFDYDGFRGRAFERGYNCRDMKELARVCGVRLG